ncbi:hypothetical protein HanXRQr2_Chr12g0564501 [Helianthus annuus]|uniref:Uncharacterized protein n=1 Tax=Helianthus annuus TaxID=4232 RepID=A0A9K3HK58_HELAN|nr:hypothetical protein HanXRQr2_Chr12g0564501 [Helianthus annuus]KAJ0679860.1 hypothetical protein HanOQP8_Chr12g0464401 [Helianthus annuus]
MGIQVQSVVNDRRDNMTCWPIVDTFLVNGIQNPRLYEDNGLVNSGFEVGPSFIDNSSQGILLEADSDNDPFSLVQSPLQYWTILGTLKYIDSKHYVVPRGRGAVELLSGDPSGIVASVYFLKHGQVTLEFIMGDANDSIGVGSRERHSVTFKAEFSNTESVPISFYSFNETRTRNHQVLCGPVILRFSSGLRTAKLYNGFLIFNFILAIISSIN